MTADVYNVTLVDLGADTYNLTWSSWGNGTENNYNTSDTEYYTITKNTSLTGDLASTNGWTIDWGEATTVSLSESNPTDDDVTYSIFRDDVDKGTGEMINASAGTYEYILNTTGGVNYSAVASLDAETLTIDKIQASVNLSLNYTYSNVTVGEGWTILLNGTTIKGDNVGILELYNNSIRLGRNGTEISNETEFNEISEHNITVIYFESENFTQAFRTYYVTVTALNLTIDGVFKELGTNTVVNATYIGVVCVDIDHPDYGVNYSCGVNSANFTFNITYFRNDLFANGSLLHIMNTTDDTKVSNFSVGSHQYDEVEGLSVNMSSIAAGNITFYKCNSTDYDRAYDGVLRGSNIELTNFTNNLNYVNMSFSSPQQEIFKYFYLDLAAKTNLIGFTLNVSGALFGADSFDVFENFSNIEKSLTTGDLVSTGSTLWSDFQGNPYTSYGWLMLANSSKRGFIYDDYDGTVDPDKWINFTQPPFCVNIETANFIYLNASVVDGVSATVNCGLLPNWTSVDGMSAFTTDNLRFDVITKWYGKDTPGSNAYDGSSQVLLHLGNIWNSSRLPMSGDPGFGSVETGYSNVSFQLDKINGTTWTVNISGFEEISQDQWYNGVLCGGAVTDDANMVLNWTTGTWTIDDLDYDGCDQSGNLNNSFYWSADYNKVLLRINSHGYSTTNAEAHVSIYIYGINRTLWYRDNSTITSK
ncbi:hypothetical protein LCGC14_1869080, partial [marine sediment metagenome]